jgi:SAM-dependent methyltransferase
MTQDTSSSLLGDVSSYYGQKLKEHGDTPSGVDWNSKSGQVLRFQQLEKIISHRQKRFSLSDIGCGYGALHEYLARHHEFSYLGVDISPSMIQVAENRHRGKPEARFIIGPEPDVECDYCVASGIFNIRLDHSDRDWSDYLYYTLGVMNKFTKTGFAFNCLSKYSDEDKRRNDLFYADPCDLFDHCKNSYSQNVTLLHDYGLYEFTILVRKQL